jgi:hypothetical protein
MPAHMAGTEIMTDLTTAVATLAFLTVVLQVVAWKTYKNEVLWAASDFAWLVIAVPATITLAFEARKDEA